MSVNADAFRRPAAAQPPWRKSPATFALGLSMNAAAGGASVNCTLGSPGGDMAAIGKRFLNVLALLSTAGRTGLQAHQEAKQ
jgi:hypothetical protein